MTDREYFRKSDAANAWAAKAFSTICANFWRMDAQTYKKARRQIARFEKASENIPCDHVFNCSFFGKVNGTWRNQEITGDKEQISYWLRDLAASARYDK